jgi:hypothetical protein
MKDDSFHFHECFLAPDDIADAQDNICKRVLNMPGEQASEILMEWKNHAILLIY